MELSSWGAAQDLAARLRADRDWPGLWQHILSLPVPQAVQAAQHLRLGRWRPPTDADDRLAQLLVGADHRTMARVVESVPAACTRSVADWVESLCPAAFAFREPVAALNLSSEDMSTSRIVTVDRTGVRQSLYEGPATHWSLCCLDTGTVIARRESGAGPRTDSQIVEYTTAGEAVLAGGNALLDAQVRGTALGFMVGFKLVPSAFALADGVQVELDLGRHGLRGGDVLAVDATGTRIAFADGNRVLVTDARLQPLLAHTVGSARDGFTVTALGFTADSLVVAGDRGELRRFVLLPDRLAAATTTGGPAPRVILELAPVPAWDLVVGDAGNDKYFFDASTLDRVPVPQFLGETDYVVGLFAAAPQGRLAVHEAGLFPVGQADPQERHPTVVHDLAHPLNALARPVRSLTSGDGAADTAYQLSPQQEDVLGVVRAAAELRPAVPEDAGSGPAPAQAGRDGRRPRTRWWRSR